MLFHWFYKEMQHRAGSPRQPDVFDKVDPFGVFRVEAKGLILAWLYKGLNTLEQIRRRFGPRQAPERVFQYTFFQVDQFRGV